MIIQHNLRVKKSKHDMNRNPDWRLSYFTLLPRPTLQPLNGDPPVAGLREIECMSWLDGYGKFTNRPIVIFSDKLSVFTLGWNVPCFYICNRSWLILVYQSIQYLIWKSTIQFPVKPKSNINQLLFFLPLQTPSPYASVLHRWSPDHLMNIYTPDDWFACQIQ